MTVEDPPPPALDDEEDDEDPREDSMGVDENLTRSTAEARLLDEVDFVGFVDRRGFRAVTFVFPMHAVLYTDREKNAT